jgi:HPr kinase/phosphorylase
MSKTEGKEIFKTVRELYESKARALKLRLAGGINGLENRITSPRIQKLGLALAGYTDYLHPGRVQFVGRSEASFLSTLAGGERKKAVARPFQLTLCTIVVTGGLTPPQELLDCAKQFRVPLLLTDVISSRAIDEIGEYLEQSLSPTTTIHAVLMEIYGLGVLILGKSGIGKSECGLELILRGHRLISDDLVVIRRVGSERLTGSGPDFLQFHMELRGLGIINIRDLFGISSVTLQKQIDFAVELVGWGEQRTDQDPVGFEPREFRLLDAAVPLVSLPVASGRNVAALVEVAVRIHMLRKQGYEPTRHFRRELERRMEDRAVGEDLSGEGEQ